MGRPNYFGDDDDDLLVDMEETDDLSGLPPETHELEAEARRDIESYNLPEGEEEGREDQGEREQDRTRKPDDDEDDAYALRREVEEARRATIEARAQAIWERAENEWNFIQSQVANADIGISSLDMRIEQANNRLAAARSDGDTVSEVKIENELRSLIGLKTEIQTARSSVQPKEYYINKARSEIETLYASARSAPRGKRVGGDIVANNRHAENWAKSNSWMASNKDASNFVISKSNKMVKDGWDQNTPGFYAELSREVERAFPGLKVGTPSAKSQPIRRSVAKSPTVASRSSMPSGMAERKPSVNATRYTLTRDDQSAMRRMNLDPQNKKHRLHFAKSRIETARSGKTF